MQDLIDGFTKLNTTATSMVTSLNGVTENFEAFAKNMTTVVAGINNAARGSDDGLQSINSSINGLISAGKSLSGIFGNLSDVTLGAGNGLDKLISNSLSAFENIKDVGMETIKFYDEATSRQRGIEKASYQSLSKFGKNFDEVRESGKIFDEILISNSKMVGSLNISGTALNDMRERFESNGIVITKQTDTVRVLGQELSALQVAYLQSAKVGMSAYEYSQQISAMMREQGASFEDATLTMAGYSDIAEETGLSTSSMMNSINGATSNFQKLGVTVAFGRPIMEAFAESLTKIGIGIENASGLASTFSRSLLDVANNYGMAYIISQKAGMDTGGGFLSAGIKMQGMYEGASPEEQEEAAVTTAMGMKKYLEDMFGGQIVTRREAEESPELGMAFYAQQQTLMGQFGIGDQASATRTLEVLEQIDSALAAGDKDLADKLSKDLKDQADTEDQLLSETQKMGIAIQGMAVETSIQTALLAAEAKKTLGGDFLGAVSGAASAIGAAYKSVTKDLTGDLKEAATKDTKARTATLESVFGTMAEISKPAEGGGGTGADFGRVDVTEREDGGKKVFHFSINVEDKGQGAAKALETGAQGLAAAARVTEQAQPSP